MRTIIINGSNLVPNAWGDTYTYRFPQGSVSFNNDAVAVASISMYFSFFNISGPNTTGQYNNNKFQYIWTDASGSNTYDVVLPDGYYEYSTINEYLQYTFLTNGHYLIDNAGNFRYYMEILANTTYYAVQLVSNPLPTVLPAGWSLGPGVSGLPVALATPQFVILADNNFKKIVGYESGIYPASIQATNFTALSQNTPQISPIQSIVMACSLLNNKYALPSTLLYSFNPAGAAFGSLINIQPPSFAFNDIQDGSYNFFTITFTDQDLNRVYIKDTNIVVLLVIQKKEAYLLT